MSDNPETTKRLLDRLDQLNQQQEALSKELAAIREEIVRWQTSQSQEIQTEKTQVIIPPIPPLPEKPRLQPPPPLSVHQIPKTYPPAKPKSDVEKVIGENLINKVGIAITIIGVAIGAKYSIDKDLISPLMRILLGYGAALALLLAGIRIKKSYAPFSAVLVSGGIAIAYLMTYLAYSFYGMMPQLVAFGLMVIFTVFTVAAAVTYNKPVIAHIGLVGAYAVPILLGDNTGSPAILFTYMTIINAGILFIALRKYWKSVYYAAFSLTWAIFLVWFFVKYTASADLSTAFIFLGVFFVLFYSIFLAYKVLRNERFETEDIILLLVNSFIFYGVGYSMITHSFLGDAYLGLFTLGNALIHFLVALLLFTKKLGDRNLFYLAAGLCVLFITITIPVQLDGSWVTLLWAGEAVILFWIGRTKDVPGYEKLSYPMMAIALISLLHDWSGAYDFYGIRPSTRAIIPFINIQFLTGLLFIAAFGLIHYLRQQTVSTDTNLPAGKRDPFLSWTIPVVIILVSYFTIFMEIQLYWDQQYAASAIDFQPEGQEYSDIRYNEDLQHFKYVWLVNYSLLFFSVLGFLNNMRLKSKALGSANIIIDIFVLGAFLAGSLFSLSELRESYLHGSTEDGYVPGIMHIILRYLSYGFVALMLYSLHRYARSVYMKDTTFNMPVILDLMLAVTLVWITSSELITWMDMLHSPQTDKLALSILWGISSLVLIALGIRKKKKHLRIGAIVLFAVTLIKLLLYDLSHMDTIAKTIVFVALGLLLLVISFLYNKYKDDIGGQS